MAIENKEMTVRQRGRSDRAGKSAAEAMYGGSNPNAEPEKQPVKHLVKNPQKDNYRTASEFYAGPSQPGKVRGMRRTDAGERDQVAILLTDEGIMTGGPEENRRGRRVAAAESTRDVPCVGGARGAAAEAARQAALENAPKSGNGKVPKVPLAERNNIDHALNPTADPPQWRPGVRLTHPTEPMDAPYFEEMDPRPARDVPPQTGKRHLSPRQNQRKIFIDPSKPLTPEEQGLTPSVINKKGNRANQSVNVLCLHHYTKEQLNEPKEVNPHLGPRKWNAPECPPRRKPHTTPIKTAAKNEHDVLGTGRWGSPEEPKPQGVGRGSCRPQKDTANLFAGDVTATKRRNWVPPNEVRKQSARQKKYAGEPNLLTHYDPAMDPTGERAPPSPPHKPHGNRHNEQSRPMDDTYRASRAPGAYAKNGQPSTKSYW